MKANSLHAAVTVIVASTHLAGCDGGARNVSGSDGAPIVLESSDVHVVGTTESIALVQDMEVLSDGSIWVLNSVAPFFVGFGVDGGVVHEFGSPGGGPEEFRMPSAFVSGGIDAEAWALDVRRGALIEISRPGSDWAEILLPRDSLPPGSLMPGRSLLRPQVRTARLGDEIILPRSTGSLASGMFAFSRSVWGADLVAIDRTGTTARSVLSLGDILGDPTAAFAGVSQPPPMLLWFRLWAVCSGDEIRVYDRLRNEVRRFTGDGAELNPTPLPPPDFTEVTADQFARAIFAFREAEITGEVGRQVTTADSARLINQIVQDAPWTPAQLTAILPRYVDFRCTDGGVLWLQPFDREVGGLNGGRSWLRIAPDGESQEVRLPDRFDPYRFTADRIWGVQRNDFDVASVAWIVAPG